MDEIMRRIRGRRSTGYTDGVLQTTKRNAQSIVRTSVHAASDRARTAFHKANEDVIKGYNVVLALDTKTCLQCVSKEDGNTYPISERPRKPFHIECRCEVVAVTKSFRELGIDLDEAPEGTRASMDGQVPQNWTNSDWFERQNEELKKDILGPSRYQGYKNGHDVTAFSNRNKILTLDELRAMEPDLFN